MKSFLFTYLVVAQIFVNGFDGDKSYFHDYYLSLCEIEYIENSHKLEISIRIFNDDLEKAVFNYNQGRIYDLKGNQTPESNEKLKSYILSKFALSIDKKQIRVIDFVGWETEKGAAWCFLEVKEVDNFKALGVRCDLLTEMFKRQKNLIYLKKNKTEKSVILDKERTFSIIEL